MAEAPTRLAIQMPIDKATDSGTHCKKKQKSDSQFCLGGDSMQIITFPFYFLLCLILAIACAKWFASRLRHQTTVVNTARARIKSTESVLPIVVLIGTSSLVPTRGQYSLQSVSGIGDRRGGRDL